MQVAVVWATESRLDLGSFLRAAESVTGKNHARATDAKRLASTLAADVAMLDDFAGNQSRLSLAVTYVGFLFAGLNHDVQQVIEHTRGMPHLHTEYVDPQVAAVVIVGSLDEWHKSIVEGCKPNSSAPRAVFNNVYHQLRQRGFGYMFDGTKTRDQNDGTFLIESK